MRVVWLLWYLPSVSALQCFLCNTTEPNCSTGTCDGELCFATATVVTTVAGEKEELQKGCVATNGTTKPSPACGLIVESDTVKSWSCTCNDKDYCNTQKPTEANGTVECSKGDPQQATDTCMGSACFYSAKSLGCTGESVFADLQMFGFSVTGESHCATVAGVEQCYCRRDECNKEKPLVSYNNTSLVRCQQCSGNTPCTECTGNACRAITYRDEPDRKEKSCLSSTAVMDIGCKVATYVDTEVTHCICDQEMCNAEGSPTVQVREYMAFRDEGVVLNETDRLAVSTAQQRAQPEKSKKNRPANADQKREEMKSTGPPLQKDPVLGLTKLWDFQNVTGSPSKVTTGLQRDAPPDRGGTQRALKTAEARSSEKAAIDSVTGATLTSRMSPNGEAKGLRSASAPPRDPGAENPELPSTGRPVKPTGENFESPPQEPAVRASSVPTSSILSKEVSEPPPIDRTKVKDNGRTAAPASPSSVRIPGAGSITKPPAAIEGVISTLSTETAENALPAKKPPGGALEAPGVTMDTSGIPNELPTGKIQLTTVESPAIVPNTAEVPIPTDGAPPEQPLSSPAPDVGLVTTLATAFSKETKPPKSQLRQKDAAVESTDGAKGKRGTPFHISLSGKKGEKLTKTIEIPSKNGKKPIKIKIEVET